MHHSDHSPPQHPLLPHATCTHTALPSPAACLPADLTPDGFVDAPRAAGLLMLAPPAPSPLHTGDDYFPPDPHY